MTLHDERSGNPAVRAKASDAAPRRRVLSRRNFVLAVALVVVGLIVFVVFGGVTSIQNSFKPTPMPWDAATWHNTGVLGDLDGDGKVSASERQDLAVTQQAEQVVAKQVAPTKGIDSIIVTPSGSDWWNFVTAQAYTLPLVGTSVPQDVNWYAYTEGRVWHPLSDTVRYYEAISINFPSAAAAATWMHDNRSLGTLADANSILRGTLLTLTPLFVDPQSEPYPKPNAAALSAVSVKEGYWVINYGAQIVDRALEAADPVSYRKFVSQLGYTSHSTWAATSPKPNTPWVGALAGYDEKQLNGSDAITTLNQSAYRCASFPKTCRAAGGISTAVYGINVLENNGAGGGQPLLQPNTSSLPKNWLLAYNEAGEFRGQINAGNARKTGVIQQIDTVVTNTGLQTITVVYGDPLDID